MTAKSHKSLRIPTLDGLRAISIVLVVLSHLGQTRGFPSIGWTKPLMGSLGTLGVRVFFVISGFLITSLLIDERARTNRISIRDFYIRRGIRILPAMILYFVALFVGERLGWLSLRPGDWPHALTFTMNYWPNRAWYVGHLWSLSVEEQFYLLWPATVAFVGVVRGLRAAAAVVVICPIVRIGIWFAVPAYREYIDESFETVADAIAVGCVLAGTRERLGTEPLYKRLIESRAFFLVPFAILAANAQDSHPKVYFLVSETVENVGIALIIDWCVRDHDGRVGRFLESAPLRFIGVRSYSLYLWQQAFVNRESTAAIAAFPWNISIALVCATLSYGLVERPLVKLRAKFSK